MNSFDVTKSLKLKNYLDSQKLTEEDYAFISELNLENLMLQSDYENVKTEVERYNTLKKQIENREGDMILTSDEMKRLRNDVFAMTNYDIETIDLNQLNTAIDVENVLHNSGIVSKNDLTVRYPEEQYKNNSGYVKMELSESDDYQRLGILTGSRMAIGRDGTILVPRSSIYNKSIY